MNTRGKNERGVSAVEYGLIVAAVAVVLIATLKLFGATMADAYMGDTPKCADEPNAPVCYCDPSQGDDVCPDVV